METPIDAQVALLSGVRTLGLYTESNSYFEAFSQEFAVVLSLADFVSQGTAALNESGSKMISALWELLLHDHLCLEDEGFKDLNDLVIAIYERGCLVGTEIN